MREYSKSRAGPARFAAGFPPTGNPRTSWVAQCSLQALGSPDLQLFEASPGFGAVQDHRRTPGHQIRESQRGNAVPRNGVLQGGDQNCGPNSVDDNLPPEVGAGEYRLIQAAGDHFQGSRAEQEQNQDGRAGKFLAEEMKDVAPDERQHAGCENGRASIQGDRSAKRFAVTPQISGG